MIQSNNNDFEWRQLLLGEIKQQRKDFQTFLQDEFRPFKEQVIAERAETKSRWALITGTVSFVVSSVVAFVIHAFSAK